MDFFSQHKFTTLTIILLVVLNLFTLSVILIREFRAPAPPDFPGQDPGRADRVMHFLRNELDLSRDQVKHFIQLRRNHFEAVQQIETEMKDIKKKMMDELFTAQPDEKKLEALAQTIGQLESRRELITFRHFMELKGVCKEEQREKFEFLLQNVIQREQRLERRQQRLGRRMPQIPREPED